MGDKIYNTTDDRIYGTKFVYCTQHMRVHETGWCTVRVADKIALLSNTLDEACEEWYHKKVFLTDKFLT